MKNVLRVIVVGLVALALQAGLAVAAVDTSNWQKVELTDGAVVTLKLPQDMKETGRKELDKGIWKYQFKNQSGTLVVQIVMMKLKETPSKYPLDAFPQQGLDEFLAVVEKMGNGKTVDLKYVKTKNEHLMVIGRAKDVVGYQLVTMVSSHLVEAKFATSEEKEYEILPELIRNFEF